MGDCQLGALTDSAIINSPGHVTGAHAHNISTGSEFGRPGQDTALSDTGPEFSKTITLIGPLPKSL